MALVIGVREPCSKTVMIMLPYSALVLAGVAEELPIKMKISIKLMLDSKMIKQVAILMGFIVKYICFKGAI